MHQNEIDSNLLVVTAIAGYAQHHNMTESEAFAALSKYDVVPLIRNQYEALHTQPLDETVAFVEDVMAQYTGKSE